MKTKRVIIVLVVLGGLAAFAIYSFKSWERRQEPVRELTVYGNVELRQVSLAFNNSERIASVLVEEGDRVKRGQVLAKLDTRRLAPLVAQAEAQVAGYRQVVGKLRSGSRPEEVAQARALVESARANAADGRRRYERSSSLNQTSALSQQDLESAKVTADVAEAQLTVSQKTLDLIIAGPRHEDIAEAEARLLGSEAQLAALNQQLADADLLAPVDAVVRTRVMEPGEMASPQKPVLTLAVTEPKWIRAYIGELNLGKVGAGMKALVESDSFPGQSISGQVSSLSSVAEFTPKTLQTQELRASLVYEIRILVNDREDRLRLGMPVTVRLVLDQAIASENKPRTRD